MTMKKRDVVVCDVDGCNNVAVYKCANCDCDICDKGHSHKYGDGGHIEHAVRVTVIPHEYSGEHEFWLCPKCFVDTGLDRLNNKSGKHVKGTGGYHAGETMG